MNLRKKLKKAKRQLQNQEKVIAGLERGNQYLFGLCEQTKAEAGARIKEMGARNELMTLLLAGCVLAAGGEISIHTENLRRVLEEHEIVYKADHEKHKAEIRIREKRQG